MQRLGRAWMERLVAVLIGWSGWCGANAPASGLQPVCQWAWPVIAECGGRLTVITQTVIGALGVQVSEISFWPLA